MTALSDFKATGGKHFNGDIFLTIVPMSSRKEHYRDELKMNKI